MTDDNARERVDQFVNSIRGATPPRFSVDRGVVIAAGGAVMLARAYVCVKTIREIAGDRDLPIQVWYLGDQERCNSMFGLLSGLGVDLIDATQVNSSLNCKHPRLGGWELKAFSMVHCPFRNVVSLDSDNTVIRSLGSLLDSVEFARYGAMFWPDYGRLAKNRKCWKVFGGIEYRDEPEFESGQMIVDKERCWRELLLSNWYNEQSDFFYRHVHGDKDTFHLAWRKLGKQYYMCPFPIDSLNGVMCQHGPDGARHFQHRNSHKLQFVSNVRVAGFLYEQQCLDWMDEARGAVMIDCEITESDRKEMQQMEGVRLRYIRVGYDQRILEFKRGGEFGKGGDRCERVWLISHGSLHIYDEGMVLTCKLQRSSENGLAWYGKWENHERMPIRLEVIQ